MPNKLSDSLQNMNYDNVRHYVAVNWLDMNIATG